MDCDCGCHMGQKDLRKACLKCIKQHVNKPIDKSVNSGNNDRVINNSGSKQNGKPKRY